MGFRVLEHQKLLETETELREALPKSVPNLSGKVEFISFVPKEQGVIVAIFANIKNDGAPSIADIGPIKVVLPGGRQIEAVTLSVPYSGISFDPPSRAYGDVPSARLSTDKSIGWAHCNWRGCNWVDVGIG